MEYVFQTDTIISRFTKKVGEKELVPWDSSDNSSEDCELDFNSNGWDVNDMFERNEQVYGITSDFDKDLSGYTMPLSIDDSKTYKDAEAKAAQIAKEIESSRTSRVNSRVEHGEEEKYAAVLRSPLNQTISSSKGRGSTYAQFHKQFKINRAVSKPVTIPSSNYICNNKSVEQSTEPRCFEKRVRDHYRQQMSSLAQKTNNINRNARCKSPRPVTFSEDDDSSSHNFKSSVFDKSCEVDLSYNISKSTSHQSFLSANLEEKIPNEGGELFDNVKPKMCYESEDTQTDEGRLLSKDSIVNCYVSDSVSVVSNPSLDRGKTRSKSTTFSLNPHAKPFVPMACGGDQTTSIKKGKFSNSQVKPDYPKLSSNNGVCDLSPTNCIGDSSSKLPLITSRTLVPVPQIPSQPLVYMNPVYWQPIPTHNNKIMNAMPLSSNYSPRTILQYPVLGSANVYPFHSLQLHQFYASQDLYSSLPQCTNTINSYIPVVGQNTNPVVPNMSLVGEELTKNHPQPVSRLINGRPFIFSCVRGNHSHIIS